MKKKILALCIALLCVISSNVVLASNEQYYDFSQTLSYAESEKLVTRAEFSQYLSNLLNKKGISANLSDEQSFSDMTTEHNYYTDVLLLKNLSIVNGDGNGIFRPDDNITYAEAVTMISRVFATDQKITENHGTYPLGYVKYAANMGLLKGVAARFEDKVNLKDLYILLNNVEQDIKVYDIMEKLGCDTYNGEVYIDYYPKNWQGFEEKPITGTNGYFKILPAKLMYSYDNVNWNTLYEDIGEERVYYNLPADVNIEGARYAWEYNCFVNAPFDVDKKYYSYDNKTWFEGTPDNGSDYSVPLYSDTFTMGINKESIIFDADSGLYFAWQPYETNSYMSKRYETVLLQLKYNMIWVSKDSENWIGIQIPEDMMFFTSAGINRSAKALIIDGAVNFTQEEQEYINNEEKTAAELGLGYDKPLYKTEKYILKFSDINKLFE